MKDDSQNNTDTQRSIRSDEFSWADGRIPESHSYLAPTVLRELEMQSSSIIDRRMKVLDIGCGNGGFTARMSMDGYEVVACDQSQSGLQIAAKASSDVTFFQQDINVPLPEAFRGIFDVVVSLEVIEHLFKPRSLLDRAREALVPGGMLILSTPYHGYLKNLALAVFNKFDDHWHPLRDFGHIKFFSKRTLLECIEEEGYQVRSFYRVGRIRMLAKSMIAAAQIRK